MHINRNDHMILLTRAEEIILIAIYKLGDKAYGVPIREQVKQDIGRYWPFGVIYKTLKKMTVKAYVEKIASEPVAERGGRSKYYYRMTPRGLEALEEISRVQTSLWDSLDRLSLSK